MLKTILKGVQRDKTAVDVKLQITMQHLVSIKGTLYISRIANAQFWTALLICFYGLLRVSNVTAKLTSVWDESKILRRCDLNFTRLGVVLKVRSAKNLQFKDRV